MNLDDMEQLKFDRRLEQRRDWLEPGEREAHLENLPDAAGNVYDGSEDEAPAAASETAPAAPAAPTTQPATSLPEGGLGGSSV